MLNSIKASIKDTFIFGFGNVAVKVIGLILIPLYTNPVYFKVEDFGIIGMLDITGQVLIAIFASSIPQSLTRWYWAKDQTTSQGSIFFMSFITQVVISLLFCLVFIPVSGNLSELLFENDRWKNAIVLITISSALQSVNNVINTLLRLRARSMLFMISNLGKLLMVLLLTVYFIVYRKMSIEGIYLAQVIGNSVIILIPLPFSIRHSKPSFNMDAWKPMMLYGLPLAMASFATVMLNVVDRYALNSLAPLKFVAVYIMAVKLSSTLKLVLVDTIKLAVFPQMIKRIDLEENKVFYPRVMLYSSYAVMFGIIGLSLFSLEAVKILSKAPDLWAAASLVPFLGLSMFFINMREVSIYGLIAAKKTGRISIIVFVSAALNILLNILFVPMWNATGSAFATFLSQFFYWIILHYFAQSSYYIPYENKRLMIIFFTGSLISFSGLLLNEVEIIPRILIKILLLGSFPVFLYFLGFYEKTELVTMRTLALKWSNLRNLRNNLRTLKNVKDETFIE